MHTALFFRLFLLQFSSAISLNQNLKQNFMRVNIFNQIHKGLRALLYESSLLLQQTDFSDEQEMKAVINRVTVVADLFDDHAHHEDTYVLPAIQQYEPSIVDAFEQEHAMDAKLTRALKDSLQALQMASPLVRQEMANELSRTFIQFMIFNLEHMSKEENILNKILWRYYADADILDLQRKIVSSLSPWSAKMGSQWMMRGLNNPEIINWLRAVEDAAPENVFQDLFATAERELPEHRFRKVLETITEGVMLA
jgi:hemerythrin-like domain-containing protein